MYPLTRFCWISAVDRTNIDFSAQYASIIHSNLTQISIAAITMKPFMKNKFRFFHIAYIDYIIIHYDRLCRNESGHSLCHHLSFRCIRCKERRFSSCLLLCPETQFIIGVFPDIYHILHFAPPSGHWCVCQRTLGGADGHLLFHRFPIYHNVVVFGNSLEN